MRPYKEKRFNKDRKGKSRKKRLDFHKVKCDNCGKMSEVPFKPTKGKPVYCSDCFKKEGGKSGSSGPSSGDLAEINRKLDKIMKAMDIN